MIGLLCFVLAVLASPFKSKSRLEAENAVRRHQLVVLRRRLHGRVRFTNNDRWFLIQLYRWFPSILQVLTVIRPETLVRWHRAGFRCYWRWKSLRRGGRPQIETELRALIRRTSIENPLWGAPRIHGELLKPEFELAVHTSPAPIARSSPNEKPDRYAAAICIRGRPDCSLCGYSAGESCGLPVLKGATDLRRYPDAMGFCRTVTSFSSWLPSLPSLPSSLSWPCCPP